MLGQFHPVSASLHGVVRYRALMEVHDHRTGGGLLPREGGFFAAWRRSPDPSNAGSVAGAVIRVFDASPVHRILC
jgi:hypothetical protein